MRSTTSPIQNRTGNVFVAGAARISCTAATDPAGTNTIRRVSISTRIPLCVDRFMALPTTSPLPGTGAGVTHRHVSLMLCITCDHADRFRSGLYWSQYRRSEHAGVHAQHRHSVQNT